MAKKNTEAQVTTEVQPKTDVDVKAPTGYPELSTEQKLRVRDLQINLVTTKERAANEIKAAEQALLDGVNGVAKELEITTAKGFDLAALKFHD